MKHQAADNGMDDDTFTGKITKGFKFGSDVIGGDVIPPLF